MKEIILASKSPYRKQLLERLGIEFKCMDSGLDESELKNKISDPIELTKNLALAKAQNIATEHPDSLIIGSDQVCHFNGQILGKTGSLEGSLDQLLRLQGQEHELVTSYAIIDGTKEIIRTNTTTLKMRELSSEQIKKYLSIDNPIDCAGSYKLELNGIGLMEKISTEDYTAIIGLPLIELGNDLNTLGVSVPPK